MAVVSPEREAAPVAEAGMPARRFRRRHRRGLLALGGVAALVVGALAYVAVGYTIRPHPGAEAIGSALRTFRRPGPAAGGAGGRVVPRAGVYTLRGAGTEHISFPPDTQSDSAVMPATVRVLAGGCWRWHLDYNVAHWEEFVFCPGPAGLRQGTSRNWQSWDLGVAKVTNLATIACPPGTVVMAPSPTTGETLTWSCPETNSAMAGRGRSTTTARVVGIGPLSIGGRTTLAVHQLQQTAVTGTQLGTVTEDWWLAADTGLPLRVERHIVVHTDSPLGTITYVEAGSWQLASLTPRR